MAIQIRVLLVEDSEDDALLLIRELRNGGYEEEYERVFSADRLRAALDDKEWDVIISDYAMPGFSGLQALQIVKEKGIDIPFILVSGTVGEDIAVEAMKQGCHDYLLKGKLTRLVPAIEREMREARIREERRQAEEALQRSIEELRSAEEELASQNEELKVVEEELRVQNEELRIAKDDIQAQNLELQKALWELKLQKYALDEHSIVAITDPSGDIIYVNDKFCKISQYSRAELIGQNHRIIKSGHHSLAFYVELWKTITAGKVWNAEFCNRAKDGSLYWEDTTIVPFKDEAGRITQYIAIRTDITERKRAEKERAKIESQLRQQQKLESIGTLASGVAHEINNPINGIMNYAQLISNRLDPESPLREFADEIGHETERVAEIVRHLLSFARQEKESHSPANIADIVNNTVSLIRTIIRRDQISLELDVPDGLPKINCRSQQIQQVLMNLLTNARDALNERYPEHDSDKIMKVTVRPLEKEGRPWFRLTVEDHGGGIPGEIRDRLFDPFFTTKDRTKGTGLGLSISHGIVQDHKGALHFESESGHYTRFHLDLQVDNDWSLSG